MEDERPFTDDIADAVREGRVSAATAAEWLRLRQEEHRRVRAHATRQLRDRAHQALDTALDGGGTDEYSRLFDPRRPLGPPLEHQQYPSQSLVYPGEGQGKRSRSPVTWDGYVQGAAMSDDELFNAMFPGEYRRASGWGGDDE